MNNPQDSPKPRESKAAAGAAGIGGGTILAAIANYLPPTSPFRTGLILVSPSVSVVLGLVWLWAQVEIANYVQDRKLTSLVQNTKATLVEALRNPTTSLEHKEVIRKKLEELELMIADRGLLRIKSLSVISSEGIRKSESTKKQG